MWHCPKCRAEVDAGFEVCWSCGTSSDGRADPSFRNVDDDTVELPALPPPPAGAAVATEKLISIASYWSPARAHAARCQLEAQGIPVFVFEDWSLGPTTDTKLQVREVDQDKAVKVLAELPPESPPEPEPPAPTVAPKPAEPAPAAAPKKSWWARLFARSPKPAAATPAPAAAPPAPEPPPELTAWEINRRLESQLSNLMDSKHTKDWKVNPAFHPDVNAFIQQHSNNSVFAQKARGLQANRAKYYATIRAQELAPKPPPEPEPTPLEALVGAPVSTTARQPLLPKLLAGVRRWLRRLVKITIVLLVLAVAFLVVASVMYRRYGEKQLDNAVGDTDKADPDWRWETLQFKRPAVPDEENGARIVQETAKKLPEDWSPPSDEAIQKLAPNVALPTFVANSLHTVLKPRQAALDEGRGLARLSTGRYPALASNPAITMAPSAIQLPWEPAVPNVLAVLEQSARLQAHDGDAAAALESVRAMLAAANSMGDDPLLCRWLEAKRGALGRTAAALERTLGQCKTPTEEALAAAQRQFQKAADHPDFLAALRGERVIAYEFQARSEAWPDYRAWVSTQPWLGGVEGTLKPVERWVLGGWFPIARGERLKAMNQAIKIAQAPAEEQSRDFRLWEMACQQQPATADMALPVVRLAELSQENQALLRCAATALAVERYHLANSKWPTTLDQLVPNYLEKLPVGPMQINPTDSGVEIACTGPGQPLRFRLYDVDQRRQPADGSK